MNIRERTFRSRLHEPGPLIVVVTIFGLFLRLIDLPVDPYADELWIIKSATSSFTEFWQAVLSDWVHPPLYFFIMRGLNTIFELDEASGRVVSILFGSLSVPAIYWLGKRLFGRGAGTIVAILLAFSPMHIWHSDYGRHYSLFVLLVILSMLAFVELWRNPRSLLWSALFVLFNSLLVYTHYIGWLLVLVETLTCTLFRVMSVRKWLILHATLGFSYVPWLIFVIPLAFNQPSTGPMIPQLAWLGTPGFLTPIRTLIEFNGAAPGAGLIGILFLAGLAMLTLKRVFERRPEWPLVIFLLLSICVPFVLVYAVSQLVTPIWLPRVMMVSLPAYYLFIAAGCVQFSDHRIRKALPLVPITWIIVAALFHLNRPHRLPFELIANYLEEHSSKQELIIAQNYYLANSLYNYYEGDGTIYEMGHSHISILPDSLKIKKSAEALLELTKFETRFSFVTYTHLDDDFRDQLLAEYRIVSQDSYTGHTENWLRSMAPITVTIYDRSDEEKSKKEVDARDAGL